MIQITPQMRILVAVEPTDFRRGIDGLAASARRRSATIRSTVGCSCFATGRPRR